MPGRGSSTSSSSTAIASASAGPTQIFRSRPPPSSMRTCRSPARRTSVTCISIAHGAFPSEGFEARPQRRARLVQPGLDRARRDAEMRGRLGLGEPGEVVQRHRLALAARQRRDRRPHARRELAAGRRRRTGRASASPAAATGAGLPQHRAADVEADADQPGAEAVVVAQPVERQHRRHDRVLGGVGRRVADHAPAARDERRVVALHQRRERVAVAAAGAADENGVGRHLAQVVRGRARGVTRGVSVSAATAPTSASAAPRLSR